jgi:hypothetical protein
VCPAQSAASATRARSLWPGAERRRVQAATASLLDVVAWRSLTGHVSVVLASLEDAWGWQGLTEDLAQVTAIEVEVLAEVFWEVVGEASGANSSIKEDEALLTRLRSDHAEHEVSMALAAAMPPRRYQVPSNDAKAGEADAGGDTSAEQHQVVHALMQRRQAHAVQYRLEAKYLRRALLGLLAVVADAWGDDSLLRFLLDDGTCCD